MVKPNDLYTQKCKYFLPVKQGHSIHKLQGTSCRVRARVTEGSKLITIINIFSKNALATLVRFIISGVEYKAGLGTGESNMSIHIIK